MRVVRLTSSGAVLALIVFLFTPDPIGATTLKRMPLLTEIQRHADVVFIGTVDSQRAERDRDRPKLIFTHVTFRDLKVVRGRVATKKLTLRFLGGRLGSERLTIAGMPTFRSGERVLLFAGVDRSWYCPVVGWHQGGFRLIPDPTLRREIVLDLAGKRIVGLTASDVTRKAASLAKDSRYDAATFIADLDRALPGPKMGESVEGEDDPDDEAADGEGER